MIVFSLMTPTHNPMHFEDTQRNKTSEGCREDVASVQDRYARGQLLARVECGEDIERSRVVGRFSDAQEEACEQQPGKVATNSRQAANDSPYGHTRRHPQARSDSSDYHVSWDADDDIAGEQNRDTSLVLC